MNTLDLKDESNLWLNDDCSYILNEPVYPVVLINQELLVSLYFNGHIAS